MRPQLRTKVMLSLVSRKLIATNSGYRINRKGVRNRSSSLKPEVLDFFCSTLTFGPYSNFPLFDSANVRCHTQSDQFNPPPGAQKLSLRTRSSRKISVFLLDLPLEVSFFKADNRCSLMEFNFPWPCFISPNRASLWMAIKRSISTFSRCAVCYKNNILWQFFMLIILRPNVIVWLWLSEQGINYLTVAIGLTRISNLNEARMKQ